MSEDEKVQMTAEDLLSICTEFARVNQGIKNYEEEVARRLKAVKAKREGLRKTIESVAGITHPWKVTPPDEDINGVVRTKVRDSVTVVDRDIFVDWLIAQDHFDPFDAFTNALSTDVILQVVKDTGELPPGLKRSKHTQIVHTAR